MRYQEAIMPKPSHSMRDAPSSRTAQKSILQALASYAHAVKQLKRRPDAQPNAHAADQALINLMKAIREYPQFAN